jgi:hypothetical protein
MGVSNHVTPGTASTDTGNYFEKWLQSQFTSNGRPPGSTASPGGSNATGGLNSGNQFNNAFNNMLGGQLVDPSGANAAIAAGIHNGAGTFGQDFGNQYVNQTFNPASLTQLSTNLLQGSGMADLSGVGNTVQTKVNTGNGMGNTATSDFTNPLQQLLSMGSNMAGNTNFGSATAGQANIGPGIALDAATKFDMNDPYFAALKQKQDHNTLMALANNNARFGAQGAGAIGSGAQLANATLQSENSANDVIALQQALQDLQQQDLAERGTKANVGLTSRGQDAQVGIANAGNSTQASIANLQALVNGQGQNSSLMSSLLGAAGSARGQDFTNQQTTNQQDIMRTQQTLDQAMKNAGFTNDRNAQDLVALIQNQGLGNTFQTNSAAQNSQNQQNNNLNSLTDTQFRNNFNQSNALNTMNGANFSNNLNSQNYQANQTNYGNMLSLGQNTNNTANNNIQNMLSLLFGSFNNSANRGLPATTNYQQGSNAGGIAAAALPLIGQIVSKWGG